MAGDPPDRPMLTVHALRHWFPALARHIPDLLTAYLMPGRIAPRIREATMLGVTSVNRCRACQAVHGRWSRTIGLRLDELAPAEMLAYAYGQKLAIAGVPGTELPAGLSARHRREIEAAALLMELANLAGNRFLTRSRPGPRLQVGNLRTARLLDLAMRALDRAGIGQIRSRTAGGAVGDVLEIGIGTGLNLGAYPANVSLQGIDVSDPALSIAAVRADRLGRQVVLTSGDAAILPYPDRSFDTIVATFVLCSVANVDATLRDAARVLRAGGTLRLLEHAQARHPLIAGLQRRSAPTWARASGGCRLDHDVSGAVRRAGLRVIDERNHAGGILVEIVADLPERWGHTAPVAL